MQPQASPTRLLDAAAMAVVVLCVAAFVVTLQFIFLAVPFAALFLLLLYYDWKKAYWILLCCIPVSIHLELIRDKLSTSLPDEPMMWLFLLVSALLILTRQKLVPSWWVRHPLTFVVFLQVVWTVVSVIYSQAPLLSLKFLIAKSWFLSCFFLLPVFIFRSKADFRTGFKILLFPIVGSMLFITARQAQVDFRFKDIEIAIGDLYYNHVEYAAVVSVFFPLVVVGWSYFRRGSVARTALFIAMLFFMPVLFLTYSRAALVGIAFAAICAYAVKKRWVNTIMPAFYGVGLLTIGLLVHNNNYLLLRPQYEQTYMHHDYSEHMAATFEGRDESSMERLYRWIAALRMSLDKPVTGFGPHMFYPNYKRYGLNTFKTYASENKEHSTTHNYFLYMLAEQGYPAMILYALLVVIVFRQGQDIYHRFRDRFYKLVTLGLVMMFAVNFITNFFSELIETHKVGALFYLNLALLVVLDHKSRQLPQA
jgi:O-antigen ligase